ncbi:MAG: hypothetical protein ACSHX9_13910 [Luteolibacter sp.]
MKICILSLLSLVTVFPVLAEEVIPKPVDSSENQLSNDRIVRRVEPKRDVIDRIVFSANRLGEGTWKFLGKDPKEAGYRFKKGVLSINSLEDVTDGLAFVYHFPKTKPKPAKANRRYDPESQISIKTERLVLDAEIKIIKQHVPRPGLAGVHLNVEDHWDSAGLMILEDRIFAYRQKEFHAMDTTDRWHHYRFVIEGEIQQIFVDDMENPVITLKRSKKAGRQWATFGDGTAGAGARAKFRNVSFSRFPSSQEVVEKKPNKVPIPSD